MPGDWCFEAEAASRRREPRVAAAVGLPGFLCVRSAREAHPSALALDGVGGFALAGALIPLGAIDLMIFVPLFAGALAWSVPAPTKGTRLRHAVLVACGVGVTIYLVALMAAVSAIPDSFDQF